MLNVGSLNEGFVLDHIKSGKSMDIYNYLGLDKLDCQVAIIKNARSNKMGRKDIIKIECPIDVINLDILGYIDHNITVNIIHNGKIGEVYNIGGHNEMRNIDIVKIICQALGKSEDLITYVTDRKGHDMRYAIDPTKIHNDLGWLPETKFADGIKLTIKWYLDNREWWETIISGEYRNYYDKMYSNR